MNAILILLIIIIIILFFIKPFLVLLILLIVIIIIYLKSKKNKAYDLNSIHELSDPVNKSYSIEKPIKENYDKFLDYVYTIPKTCKEGHCLINEDVKYYK